MMGLVIKLIILIVFLLTWLAQLYFGVAISVGIFGMGGKGVVVEREKQPVLYWVLIGLQAVFLLTPCFVAIALNWNTIVQLIR